MLKSNSIIFGIIMPLTEIAATSVATIITIVKLQEVMRWRSESTTSISANEIALTKMLVGTSIFFTVCMIPICLQRCGYLWWPEMRPGRRNNNLFFCGMWLSEIFTGINSTFNIFVYYSMGSRYRQMLWTLLGKRTTTRKA